MRVMNKSAIKNGIVLVLIIIFITLIQSVGANLIKIKSTIPDLLFALCLGYASQQKKWKSVVITALCLGVISDFLCHTQFVGNTAVYTYSAMLMYLLKNLFLKPNVFFLGVIALLTFMLAGVVVYPVLFAGGNVDFAGYFVNDVMHTSIYNMVCFGVFFFIFGYMRKREERKNVV